MEDVTGYFGGSDDVTLYVGDELVLTGHVSDNQGGEPTGTATANLWFAKSDSLLGNDKKVFAHWFPPFPDHIDNPATRDLTYYAVNYYTSNGESGAHTSTGGYLDNGPMWPGQFDTTSTSLEQQDGALDIQHASSFGYDGFVVDVITKADPQHAAT